MFVLARFFKLLMKSILQNEVRERRKDKAWNERLRFYKGKRLLNFWCKNLKSNASLQMFFEDKFLALLVFVLQNVEFLMRSEVCRCLKRGVAKFSYLVKQAILKSAVIRSKSSRSHLFDMCTFETIKSWEIVGWKFQIQASKAKNSYFTIS